MKKENFILALVGVIVLALVVSLAIYMPNQKDNDDRFSVSGQGTVYAKADIANINIGLKTEVKPTAAEVIQENSKQMDEILEAIKNLGVEEKDIKTISFQVNPSYTWIESQGQKLLGYEASQSLSLKIRDLDKIGEIISKTTEKGANQVGNIYFSFDDEYELKNEARTIAIQRAKEKAEAIALETGIKLGKIKGVYESYYNSNQPSFEYARKEMMLFDSGVEASFGGMGIEAGENLVEVEVTLVYEVK